MRVSLVVSHHNLAEAIQPVVRTVQLQACSWSLPAWDAVDDFTTTPAASTSCVLMELTAAAAHSTQGPQPPPSGWRGATRFCWLMTGRLCTARSLRVGGQGTCLRSRM